MKTLLMLLSLTACATLPRGSVRLAEAPRTVTIYEGDALAVDDAVKTFPSPGTFQLANGTVVNVLPVVEVEAAQ